MRYSLFLLLLLGCSSRLSSLTGKVTIDNEPTEGVGLVFEPDQGSPSYAETDKDGQYEAAYTHRRKGIEEGKHTVRLLPQSQRFKLPKKYFTEIEQIEIAPGQNTKDFSLFR